MFCRSASVFWSVLVLLCLAPVANAQAGSAPELSSNTDQVKYSLKGTVVNSATGEPVSRALVQLFAQPPRAVLTDSDGQFEFTDLPVMQTSLMARKPGYFSQQEIVSSSLPTVTVGPDTPAVVIPLVPEGVIFGQAKDASGEGVEGLPVSLVYVHLVEGHKRWDYRGGTATDEDGRFRIASLQPGTYYVSAGPNWRGRFQRFARRNLNFAMQREGYPQVYYPAAPDLSSGSPLQVTAGQRLEADFVMKAEALFHVAGVVTGAPPGQHVQVQVQSGQAGHSFGVRSGPVGEFETMLPAGSYTLRASTEGENSMLRAYLPVTLKSDLVGLRLAMLPASMINATVNLEDTQSPSAPKVSVFSGPSSGRLTPVRDRNVPLASVHLQRAGTLFEGQDVWLNAGVTAGEGQEIAPGKYSAEITPNGGDWYVQSAESGGTDLLRDELSIAAGGQPAPIRIVLRNDGANLSGTVLSDGQPLGGSDKSASYPVVISCDRDPLHPKTTLSAADGRFRFANVPPGNCSVLAFDSSSTLEYANPEVLAQYLSQAARVALSPGQEASSTVNLVHLEK